MKRTGGRRVSEIRDELGEMMNEKVAVFRDEKGLLEAHEVVRRLKEEAKNATIAGQADSEREILHFREPCAGPPDIQEAWAQLLAAARDGIADGEASAGATSPAPG